MLVANALSCFYSGQGKTRIVMLVDMVSVVVNIVLDYLWIFGHAGFPAAGIAGAAWATCVAVAVKLAVYLLLLLRARNRRVYGSWDWAFHWPLCRRLLKFGGPAGLQMLLEVAGFTVFVFLVGSLGVEQLAATNLAFNVSSLAFMPVFGLATAVSILVGQQLGRDAPDLAARGTWIGLALGIWYMAVVSALYVLLPDLFLFGFFSAETATRHGQVRAIAVVLLRYVAAYNLFDAMNMVFMSAIKGAGDTRFIFGASWIMAVLLAVGTWVAMKFLGAGLHGCWTLVTVWICLLGVIYGARFMQGKWRSMRVIDTVRVAGPT
jgi:MATE family multidrug resistance protein